MYEPLETDKSRGAAGPPTATARLSRVPRRRSSSRGHDALPLPSETNPSVGLQLALTSAPVLAADLLGLALPLALVSAAAAACGAPQAIAWAWLAVAAPLVFALAGLFPPLGLDPVREVARLCVASAVTLAILLLHDATALGPDRLIVLACAWIVAVPTLVWLRSAARSACARGRWWGLRTVVVGEDWLSESIVRDLRDNAQIGLRPVARLRELPPAPPLLQRRPRCHPELARQNVSFAVFALPPHDPGAMARIVRDHFASVPSFVLTETSGRVEATARAVNCRGLSGWLVEPWLLRRKNHVLRRAFSLALALPLAAAALPLCVLIALLVKLGSRGPVFYAQERIGAQRKRIRLWKFRTMTCDADAVLQQHLAQNPELRSEWERLHKLKEDPRITRAGRWLRKTSLDELPQIWNVIRGDIYLVGPRPIVEAEIPKYGATFDAYLQVAPGLTGLWQVSGRNHTTYEKRVRLDGFYARNWSIWLDLWILARTLTVVCRRQGAH